MLTRRSTIRGIAGALGGIAMFGRPRTARASQPFPIPKAGPLASVRWSLAGAGLGVPAHDGERVFFLSADRDVLAFDADTGNVLWRTPTGITNRDHIFGSTTAGNAVRVSGDVVVGGDWDIVGFDRRSGRRLWTFVAPGGDGPGLYLGDASDNTIYAGAPSGHVYAIDTASGRARWFRPLGDVPGTPTTTYDPLLMDDRLVVGYTNHGFPAVGGIAALDPHGGRILWRTAFPAAPEPMMPSSRAGGPVRAGDTILASSMTGYVHAFDPASGAMRWSLPRVEGPYPLIAPANTIDYRALAVAGDIVVAGSSSGIVTAYDLETRKALWQSDGNYWGSTAFGLAADERFAYVPYLGGTLIALDMRTGEERWRFGNSAQGFIWAPAAMGGRIFASGSYAGFYALAAPATPERPRDRPEKPN